MKYIVLNKSEDVEKIIDFLVCSYGIPSIKRRLRIYSADDKNLLLEAVEDCVWFREPMEKKPVFVKNKNLKQLFKHIQLQYQHGFCISSVVFLDFSECELIFDMDCGNALAISNESLAEQISEKLKKNHCYNTDMPLLSNPENLFDEIGNLNNRIKKYANETGLDVRSNSKSIKIRLSNISNDYTSFEKFYKLVTKNELMSATTSVFRWNNFKNMSIIIPVYNQTIIPTLLSLQGQNLPQEKKKNYKLLLLMMDPVRMFWEKWNLLKANWILKLIMFLLRLIWVCHRHEMLVLQLQKMNYYCLWILT